MPVLERCVCIRDVLLLYVLSWSGCRKTIYLLKLFNFRDDLREHLKNAPKKTVIQAQADSSSSDSSSSSESSGTDSSEGTSC
jgi:hypothetical protein